ncbi:pirin family protein [Paeniglutamicibacter cryotolerans]|uniref:Pirin family protein n=1 Tax=Paeniglutamicibacter cryotolerans TaxID=670079 RepID=A0A839QJF6_9MICC|nr:pirin family protein [Paeniglutamicibacter cryotolerans]MBB2994864.1 hypothetical protein [Paeniglutamicibacter cryotolerans]
MSNLDQRPDEVTCEKGGGPGRDELLEPRFVPLGGPRAMTVRRTLPQKRRSLIGAWCFLDHYGPDPVGEPGGMSVPRHPHTGLQTVSWLFTGAIEHRDSAGFHAIVRPGELNLMTAGRGISHSEFSTPETTVLHGAQLWVALPDHARSIAPGFEHYRPEPVSGPGSEVRVFLGAVGVDTGVASSPVIAHTPLIGAEILLEPGAGVDIAVESTHEHGVLLDSGSLAVNGTDSPVDHLLYVAPGHRVLRLRAGGSAVRALLIGGEPLGEKILMWWNFVGRTHEEVAAYRSQWQAEIGAEAPADPGLAPRFGDFPAGTAAPLPAPVLPGVRLRPRD